jgi:hypothetical protein
MPEAKIATMATPIKISGSQRRRSVDPGLGASDFGVKEQVPGSGV